MRVEYWMYQGVKPDGRFENDPEHREGAVNPNPRMDTSGGHHAQTASTERDGLWLSVSTGRLPDGTMHGITIYFSNESEMRDFEQNRSATIV